MGLMKVKAHLHLPRLKSGVDEVVSVSRFAYAPGSKTDYFGTVTMKDVKFKVSQAGRKRTLDTGVKNVHAWVVGEFVQGVPSQHHPKQRGWRTARYNPRFGPDFVDSETGESLSEARAAILVGSKVYYLP